jgi:hypothetical protein
MHASKFALVLGFLTVGAVAQTLLAAPATGMGEGNVHHVSQYDQTVYRGSGRREILALPVSLDSYVNQIA